jgi:hypothetical protein
MPSQGMLAVRGETYVMAGTEESRLTRLVSSRLWRAEQVDDVVLRTWGDRVVGVVSGVYVPVGHLDVVDALEEALSGVPFQLLRFDGNWHHLRLLLVNPERRAEARVGDVTHGGLEITNSETGFGPIGVAGFLFRLVCKNGAIFAFPLDRSTQPHCHDTREALVEKFRQVAVLAAGHLDSHLGALRRMAGTRASASFRRQTRRRLLDVLPKKSVDVVFAQLPRLASVYDVYNGVTYRAQRRGLLGRREIEEVGGEIVGQFAAEAA